jgi:ABC-type multidrug transport system fused ATPase/permease subunit
MNYIWRLFKYVWPQWHRLVIIVFSAVVMSVLLSLSFVTLVPTLKVMMGQEGLHGYIDRKICSNRYGLKFYVPDQVEILDSNNPDIAYYLLITQVEQGSLAEKAGLKPQDYIIGASYQAISTRVEDVPALALLNELASAPGKHNLAIRYRRLDALGMPQVYGTDMHTGREPFYLGTVERLMSFVPMEQNRENKTRAMTLIVILLAIFTVFRCIASFFQKYLSDKVAFVSIAELRKEIFAHIVEMPVSYFDTQNPSDSVSRINYDTNIFLAGVTMLLGKALREPLLAVGLIAWAMVLNAKLTLIFLVSAPLTVAAVMRLGKRIRRATRKTLVSSSVMLGKLNEAVSSVKVVKVYNQQDYENRTFGLIIRKLLRQFLHISKVDAATGPIMELLGMAAGCAALLFGVHWVVSGGLDASEFLTLVAMLGAAAESVRKCSDMWNKIQQANAAGERIYNLLEEPVEIERPNARRLENVRGSIEFRNVFFTYPNGSRPVLNGINLTVQAGHNIAVVGPNGSGKTTMVNLIPRFYDVDSGAVLIDGVDVRDCTLKSLRQHIGLVTQNVVTFNETIAANISYGKIDSTMDEIIAAAEKAKAHEFIVQFPAGYETKIGEHGTGLSGGQLQRIVIARAILKDPAILIFDEATSQVDADSEAKIHSAIEEIMHQRTTIIIAHRFSTVISADIIVVVDNGQIIAQGRHEQLMQSCLLYQSLYETQLVKA